MKEVSADLVVKGTRFGLVVSRFNDFLTRQLLGGAVDTLTRHGAKDMDLTVVWVPGANEAPQAVLRMAKSGRYGAIIALGMVVTGATDHADLINSQVSRSLAQIALDTGVPVLNGVVCADNLEQAIERSGTKAGNKGANAAMAAIEMVNVFAQLGE